MIKLSDKSVCILDITGIWFYVDTINNKETYLYTFQIVVF